MRVHLDACDSTQDEARERLLLAAAGEVVVVTADRQLRGRGREGRSWDEPPGAALFASIGARGPLPVGVLDALPHDVARIVLDVAWRVARVELAWKAPNDLVAVDADGGAKVGGVLVDARTQGDAVTELVVGIGVNVGGPAFATSDARRATTLESIAGRPLEVEELRAAVTADVAQRLSARP